MNLRLAIAKVICPIRITTIGIDLPESPEVVDITTEISMPEVTEVNL